MSTATSSEVVANGRYFFRAVTGVERYASEVARRLGHRIRLVRPPRELRGLEGHLWEQFSLPRLINNGTILWSPANTGPLSVTRQIITIHDCSPLDHPQWFRPSFNAWYRLLLPKLASRVLRVITVSEFSRQRILERCPVSEEKVIVIPGGVDLDQFYPRTTQQIERVCAKYAISGDYVLMVGSLEPRKNFTTLFQSWEIVSRAHQDISLVIAGGTGLAFRNINLNNLPAGVKILGYVEENDLPPLYSGAAAFINPSLYEGFGLSVLEAMASGTPVIASNTTALPEVVAEAGLLVNPSDAGEMAMGLARLISEKETREQLAQKGLNRAKNYSWERTTEQLWNTILQAQDEV